MGRAIDSVNVEDNGRYVFAFGIHFDVQGFKPECSQTSTLNFFYHIFDTRAIIAGSMNLSTIRERDLGTISRWGRKSFSLDRTNDGEIPILNRDKGYPSTSTVHPTSKINTIS